MVYTMIHSMKTTRKRIQGADEKPENSGGFTPREREIRSRLGVPDDARYILIIAESSHWDLNWMYTSEVYYTLKIKRILNKALRELKRNPRRIYSIECIFFLKMFWDRHESMRDSIRTLVNTGRIRLTGTGFTTPDTTLPDTESIIRDYLLGQEWLRENGMVQEPKLAYLPDNFGNSPALPSILSSMGFRYAAVTRLDGLNFIGADYNFMKAPLPGSSAEILGELIRSNDFFWRAGDGSEVLCHWNPFTYGQGDLIDMIGIAKFYDIRLGIVVRADWHVAKRIESYVNQLAPLAKTQYLFCPIGFDFNSPITGLVELLDRYNDRHYRNTGIFAVNAAMEDYLDLIAEHGDELPLVEHDPNPYWMGFYFSRPEIKQRSRRLSSDLVRAEKLLFSYHKKNGIAERIVDNLKLAWETSVVSNHHDFITGTSPDRIWKKEQRPWLVRASEIVDGVISMVQPGPVTVPHVKISRSPRWSRYGSLVRVESPHYIITMDENTGGCVTSWVDGKTGVERLSGPGNDLVVYRDSGGLWRMGHEFTGGTFRELDRASRRPAAIKIDTTGYGLIARIETILDGKAFTRTLLFANESPVLRMAVRGSAKSWRTVTCSFTASISTGMISMDVPGGVVERPAIRHFDPTFWSFQNFAHAVDRDSGAGFALFMGPPATVSYDGGGEFQWMVVRNTPMERAFGFLPVPAHPAYGADPGMQTGSYAVRFTADGDWKKNLLHCRGTMMDLFDDMDLCSSNQESPVNVHGGKHVRVMAVKPAFRGNGVIVRLFTPVTSVRSAAISMPGYRIRSAALCDGLERDIGPLKPAAGRVKVPIRGSITTVRLVF